MRASEVYLVWSIEHRMWWGPGYNGYVRELSRAGRYSYVEAMEICTTALGTALHLKQFAEIPVRLADIDFLVAAAATRKIGQPWE